MNGDVITGGSDDVSSEYVTDMEVQSSEGTVIITIDGQKYRVPKQRESLLRLMHERPELRYEILKASIIVMRDAFLPLMPSWVKHYHED